LPQGWEWVRIGQLAEIKGGKRLPAGHTFSDQKTPYAYIQVTNMKQGTVETENLKYLKPDTFIGIKNYTISMDDLYITIAGTIGQVGMVPKECHLMNLTENAAKIVFPKLNKEWFLNVLSSQICQHQFAAKTHQQAQPKLALHRIADALLPLPPLTEQSRMVTRVNELRSLCADLRQRLVAGQTMQSHLADALVTG
jgi:type I restriction enzyme S subunit